jgi:hypothetical protein
MTAAPRNCQQPPKAAVLDGMDGLVAHGDMAPVVFGPVGATDGKGTEAPELTPALPSSVDPKGMPMLFRAGPEGAARPVSAWPWHGAVACPPGDRPPPSNGAADEADGPAQPAPN